jgi:hypothetical protein
MKRLAAMESPSSAVAIRVASTNSVRSAPTASRIAPLQPVGGEAEVGIAGELAGHHRGAVDDGAGDAGTDLAHGVAARRHHHVAGENEVGRTGRDADGVQILRPGRDPDMAEDGAALLGEAGHVEGGAALALEMRRHAEQGPDGDDAGAADPVTTIMP